MSIGTNFFHQVVFYVLERLGWCDTENETKELRRAEVGLDDIRDEAVIDLA